MDARAQSVRSRLLNLAKAKGENYNLLLMRYGIERLLFRLGQTKHADRFVLKGAMLHYLWASKTVRPTKDLDLAGFGRIDEQELRAVFTDICAVQCVDDAIHFDAESLAIEDIREGEAYEGFRIRTRASLGSASLSVLVDIGIGDAITPDPQMTSFPTLLDLPEPVIRIYPPETVIAEKFDAICALGMRNSRMKDYYDLWMMTESREFEGSVLLKAISATLTRRGRGFPNAMPVGLTEEFGGNETKHTQWLAFCRRATVVTDVPGLKDVTMDLRNFFEPLIRALAIKSDHTGLWHNLKWHTYEH